MTCLSIHYPVMNEIGQSYYMTHVAYNTEARAELVVRGQNSSLMDKLWTIIVDGLRSSGEQTLATLMF